MIRPKETIARNFACIIYVPCPTSGLKEDHFSLITLPLHYCCEASCAFNTPILTDVNAWKRLCHFHVPIRLPKVSAQWEKCYQENRISSIDVASVVAQVCFRAIYIEEAPTVAYVYQLGEPVESYKVSPFPGNYSTNYSSHMAFYFLFSLAMSITPITPTKPLTAQLLRVISQFCMFFFDPTHSRHLTNYSVREMDNPQFMIEHGDVATYIVSSAPCDDGPITTDLLSGILSRHIGYAPPTLIKNLIGSNAGNTDLECIVVLYSLLMMDILPPSSLRTSIKRILYSRNGEDLMRHLVDNLDIGVESQLGRI
ncbi:unnamed protein product [Penicillium nalgiovense]|nr:unnamed protein product [Penicillium nalgiovense]